MAHIAILTHTYDDFPNRPYLLHGLAPHWVAAGHQVSAAEGLDKLPDADIAVLHVDQSLVPAAYAQALKRYPAVINGRALDIRKKLVSTQQLRSGDPWRGTVIVKTDLNRGGAPEMRHLHRLHEAGLPPDAALAGMAFSKEPYPILPSMADVPQAIWDNPGLVVERFLPERDPRGYWMRVWVFLGQQERCTRYLSADPLVKAGNILARETVAVPDEIRAQRERLGFDYGKFDFVVSDGKAVLLDANRTPFAAPVAINPELEAQNAQLARGLLDWVKL